MMYHIIDESNLATTKALAKEYIKSTIVMREAIQELVQVCDALENDRNKICHAEENDRNKLCDTCFDSLLWERIFEVNKEGLTPEDKACRLRLVERGKELFRQ